MTTRPENGRAPWPKAAGKVAKGSLLSLYQHWALALFSVAAAFGIWFVIQDVENPKVETVFPAEGEPASIEVKAVNADGLIPNEEFKVRIRVEGREDDLATLANDDFEATIDVRDIQAYTPTEVPVRVTATRDGLRVLSSEPSSVEVVLEPIAEKEVPVRVNPSGQLAPGLEEGDVEIEPQTVKVSGLEEQIASVATVALDINLGALGEGTTEIEGDLTARSATNSELAVTITPPRAKVTYTINQVFVQRSLPVALTYIGQVAVGYRISAIVIEPPVLTVSGPEQEFTGLTQLVTAPIPLTNATSEIRRVQDIDLQGRNLSPERSQVSVRIEIEQIQCGSANPSCPAVSMQIAPGFQNPPAGQFVQGTVTVLVKLSGPFAALQNVNPKDVTALVNLGAPTAPGLYPVTVTLTSALSNQGIRPEPVDPIPVTLGPNP